MALRTNFHDVVVVDLQSDAIITRKLLGVYVVHMKLNTRNLRIKCSVC